MLIDRLIIPSCSGVLDCFNNRLSRYYSKESMCCLQGDCDNLLVLALFSFLYKKPTNENCTYTFKIADFKKYIGLSSGGSKSKNIKAELVKLSNAEYMWEFSSEENLIQVTFNDTGTFATVSSIYFNRIHNIMSGQKGIRNRWGKLKIAGKSAYSSMVYTSILKERNVSAVEIVIEMVKLIERRGQLEEGQTAHISVLSLAERCPTLYKQLQKKQVKEQNRILRSVLEKSIDLMKIHTDMYKCFEDLKFIFPEKITFSNESVINIIYSGRIY